MFYDAKNHVAAGGDVFGPYPKWHYGEAEMILQLGAALSAYTEVHADRLLADADEVPHDQEAV